jgi:hypothetical protein
LKLVETVNAGRGFLGDAANRVANLGKPTGMRGETAFDHRKQRALLVVRGAGDQGGIGFGAGAEQNEERGVAAIVENHIGGPAVRPIEGAIAEVPILLEGFTLDGEHGDALGRNRGGGVILGGEDVAGRPAHFGSQVHKRLDEDGGLNGHVQGAGDAGAEERLCRAELLTQGHQARHLDFGHADLLAAPFGKAEIGYVAVREFGHDGEFP